MPMSTTEQLTSIQLTDMTTHAVSYLQRAKTADMAAAQQIVLLLSVT